jgi:UDP-N-acetylglucosamine 2-epimerase
MRGGGMTRVIGVVTTSRAEYGILRSVLRRITDDADLRLLLYVGGSHLSPEFGMTVGEIERDNFRITERVECLMSSDTPEGIAKSMGLTMLGFAQAYAHTRQTFCL